LNKLYNRTIMPNAARTFYVGRLPASGAKWDYSNAEQVSSGSITA